MTNIIPMIILLSPTYFETYNKEVQDAITFVSENKEIIKDFKKNLSKEDARIAMCIVAPELSQYSKIANSAETFALYTLYVQGHVSDFSIGPFQMKPSFAKTIEDEVSTCNYLYNYKDLIITGNTERAVRYERVERLSNLKWQLKYLSAFIEIVKKKTKRIKFKKKEDKLKYWATLYNAGINIDESLITNMYNIKGFPRYSPRCFNYADVCIEFYQNNEYCPYLK